MFEDRPIAAGFLSTPHPMHFRADVKSMLRPTLMVPRFRSAFGPAMVYSPTPEDAEISSEVY